MSNLTHDTYRAVAQVSPTQHTVSLLRELSPMTALEALTALHHGAGAAVAFARRGADGWEECGACLAVELPAYWPTLRPRLSQDSYFTLASTYQQNRVTRASSLGLPLWRRRTERLRWLNVVALDLDRHADSDFSAELLLESLWRELQSQAIPLPTFVLFSGRGLWALWQIADHKNLNQPVAAFPDRRELAQRITRELVKRFAPLGADRGATDSARIVRVPCSINSKAAPENSRVLFFRASATTYTLPELADVLGVRARKVSLHGERTRPKNPAKQKAAAMRWRYPLEGFRALWKMRGGFTEGMRRPALYVYSMLLRKNHSTPQEVVAACIRLAESLTPGLSTADVKRAITASEKAQRYNVSNARLAEMLKVSAKERAALPQWFRPKAEDESARIAERRALIAQELSTVRNLSTRRLARLLAEKHGIAVSRFTVARDIRSMSGAFSVLIEPKLSLCISSKNAPFLTETEFTAAKINA